MSCDLTWTRRITAFSIGLLILSGCGGGGNSSTASSSSSSSNSISAALDALQASGELPTLDVSNVVAGTDGDTNGIRDDIDQFIAATSASTSQKAALKQLAKALQASVTVDATNAQAVTTAAVGLNRSTACIWSVYDAALANKNVLLFQEITVNTLSRLTAYEKFNAALNGSVMTYPTGVICDQ